MLKYCASMIYYLAQIFHGQVNGQVICFFHQVIWPGMTWCSAATASGSICGESMQREDQHYIFDWTRGGPLKTWGLKNSGRLNP